ncbi:type III-B CRISPR module RAMP protein Cmr6 [Marinicrinis lubricantis]|uniref:Type III-B CRISPR module RAMP protein Cmr6 n=1 Tax=Marinicrinis lubricantis TaxID=2086470 RepID=A0ABW1INS4_9BACL
MNLHQMLNKYNGADGNSDLEKIVKNKHTEKKGEYYNWIAGSYGEYWTDSKSWFVELYQRHYSEIAGRSLPPFIVSSASPCIIGLGQQTVLEAGLAVHKTYGVPYIPGTALKGLAAHFCHKHLGAEQRSFRMDGDSYKVLFGSQQEAGYIRFFDALPTPETVHNALLPDVMTPHHQAYNSLPGDGEDSRQRRSEAESMLAEGRSNAPRDDDSPVPVPFLSVMADFKIMLSCDADQEEADAWLDIAKLILVQALEQEGIGGKTNAGYGRMFMKTEEGAGEE